MELLPLLQHGLDEDVQLVGALALLTHLSFPSLYCKLSRTTSLGWSLVGIVGGDLR
jgi:hypothetical protein